MGLACLSEYSSDDVTVPIGLARVPLCRYLRPKTEALGGKLDSEVFTPLPFLALARAPGDPLTGLASLQSITNTTPHVGCFHSAQAPEQKLLTCSFRGSVPFSVLPAMGSHITRRVPPHPVKLRPQGFAPSRRFAPPMTCQAYSILVPLMGFTLQGLAPPPGAVRPLERRCLPGVFVNHRLTRSFKASHT
jgi:hypothetical protein